MTYNVFSGTLNPTQSINIGLLLLNVVLTADNQHAALYGGRMTASRLFHVGQVTSEAVEQLHRWAFLGQVKLITMSKVILEAVEHDVFERFLSGSY